MKATDESLAELIRILPGYDPYAQAGDCWFDEEAAQLHIDFVETCCTHVKGELAGKPLLLEPWQKAFFANLFGWKRPDGTRRYREALFFVPRGNSKTTCGAAIVNIGLFLEQEPGAELYSSAAEADQARLCFGIVTGMIRNEPEMNRRAELFKYSIVVGDKTYKSLSAEAGSKHGFNIQILVNDELHAHKTPELTDTLMTGTGKRRQPLVVHLTTSDYERENSVCNLKHDYACKVRDGIVEDPAFLPVVYEASKEDDWTDPEIWAKANPNLGVSVPLEYIERECRRAKDEPAYENTFKRLHLNIRTEQSVRIVPIEKWDACRGVMPDLENEPCWSGLDIGAVSDLTAAAHAFPLNDGRVAVMFQVWVPEKAVKEREVKGDPTYATWVKQGFMTQTPGEEVDYSRVRGDLNDFSQSHPIQEIAADTKFQGLQLVQQLREEDGLEAFPHSQGFVGMAAPMQAFMEMVNMGQVLHDGNPVIRWMVTNLAGKQNEAGHWMPSKKDSGSKIDGVVALIMALGRAVVNADSGQSFYETHALETA